MVTSQLRMRTKLKRLESTMLCCGRKKVLGGRETTPDLATSPRRQPNPKHPPPMVIQPDFRKVSGISGEIFRQIERIENEHDGTTAAALEAVERRGEMVVRMLDPKQLGHAAAQAARPWISHQDPKRPVHLVEIVKRPGQTLGLYIREGNGMDRQDGVFISRIALESSVYNSGCLKVGDEILAVNMVDVTRMSLDDVVIIMSIPRRLVLLTRQGTQCASAGLASQPHHKPLPVVVMKGQQSLVNSREASPSPLGVDSPASSIPPPPRIQPSRSHLALGLTSSQTDMGSLHTKHSNGDLSSDPYYRKTQTLERSSWLYQPPPPPVVTEQPKSHHYQPYDKTYPKTLESLAEKVTPVHSFYPGGSSTQPRRMSATTSSNILSYYGSGGSARSKLMPRSGSDQHLPRVEYSDYSSNLATPTYRQYRSPSTYSTLSRRQRPVDYSSDTEASRPSYYYYRQHSGGTSSMLSSMTATAAMEPPSHSRLTALRSNSLPRDTRQPRQHIPTLPTHRGSSIRLERDSHGLLPSTVASLMDHDDSDGALSAPEMTLSRKHRGRLVSSPSVFTSDEYRAWLTRAPSSSAIYSATRSTGGSYLASQKASQRFHFSAENLPQRTRQSELLYSTYRPGQLATMGTLKFDRASLERTFDRFAPERSSLGRSSLDRASLDRASLEQSGLDRLDRSSLHSTSIERSPMDRAAFDRASLERHSLTSRSASLRRMHNLLELEAKQMGKSSSSDLKALQSSHSPISTSRHSASVLQINPAEFLKYKQSVVRNSQAEVSGLLWLHLLSGRGLRASSSTTNPSSLGGNAIRDLYCVLECDGVHKARTVVRTGDLVFDWDETFELDMVSNKELDFLIYSWDPQYRHKLCYKGSVQLASLLLESPVHQLAVKIEPRGTLYLRLHHTSPYHTFLRKPKQPLLPRGKPLSGGIFGIELETVVTRESIASEVMKGDSLNIPTIVRRCVEEVERRGLDIIGLYRLCGSATKKRILREAFERNPRTVDLSPDNVPDINVITGVLKDYLRELPEPLITKCLYQMLADAVSVCLPDDPEGNAKLIFSVLDCLPPINRSTLIFLMNHLALVSSQTDRNKMSTQSLAICFAPLLILHSETEDKILDFQGPINVVRYLLDIWPLTTSERAPVPPPRPLKPSMPTEPPPLPAKPQSVVVSSQGTPPPSHHPVVVPARPKPTVIASPVSNTSSSDEEGSYKASEKIFDSKANFDTKKSVFEKVQGPPPLPMTYNGRKPPPPLPPPITNSEPPKPNYDQKPVYSNGKPVYDAAGNLVYECKKLSSPGYEDEEPNYESSKPVYEVYEATPITSPSGVNHETDKGVYQPRPVFGRNNPFAEDMEEQAVTPSSSTGTEEGSRREVDADAEVSDDDDLK